MVFWNVIKTRIGIKESGAQKFTSRQTVFDFAKKLDLQSNSGKVGSKSPTYRKTAYLINLNCVDMIRTEYSKIWFTRWICLKNDRAWKLLFYKFIKGNGDHRNVYDEDVTFRDASNIRVTEIRLIDWDNGAYSKSVPLIWFVFENRIESDSWDFRSD